MRLSKYHCLILGEPRQDFEQPGKETEKLRGDTQRAGKNKDADLAAIFKNNNSSPAQVGLKVIRYVKENKLSADEALQVALVDKKINLDSRLVIFGT